MRSLKPKPSNLSRNQSRIWDAMNECSHTKLVVSNRSGICLSTLDNWLRGKNEPSDELFQDVLEAIQELSDINPRFKWKLHIKEARAMLETNSLDDVANHFGKSVDAVRSALSYAERRKVA